MAVLTFEQRRFIEARIRNYYIYKEDVAEWRKSALGGTPKRESGQYDKRRIADPTASAALKLADPPKYIRDAELWVETIDAAHRRLDVQDKAKLFDAWYWSAPQSPHRAAFNLNVSERQFQYWINDVVISVALIATQKRIFTLTQ